MTSCCHWWWWAVVVLQGLDLNMLGQCLFDEAMIVLMIDFMRERERTPKKQKSLLLLYLSSLNGGNH